VLAVLTGTVPDVTAPPDHVLAAFGLSSAPGEQLAGGRTWRFGDAVLKPAPHAVESAWAAGVFESLRVSGIRVARPLRSSDGRWVVGGWCAQRFVSGRPAARYDDIVDASFALHEALAGVPAPRFLAERQDVYSWADRLAWGETDEADRLGDGHGARLYAEVAAGRRPVDLPSQVVHGDLFGNVLFAGSAPPAVIDFTPYWRPASYAVAIIVVDAVSWGRAPTELVRRWAHLECWPQLLRRAVLFRLAVSLVHPRTTPESLVEMLTAVDVLRPLLD
jgi:uncharacterized protein (TIGR02569 family)